MLNVVILLLLRSVSLKLSVIAQNNTKGYDDLLHYLPCKWPVRKGQNRDDHEEDKDTANAGEDVATLQLKTINCTSTLASMNPGSTH
jgi:hypothetical protein